MVDDKNDVLTMNRNDPGKDIAYVAQKTKRLTPPFTFGLLSGAQALHKKIGRHPGIAELSTKTLSGWA